MEYSRRPRSGSILYQGGLSRGAQIEGCCIYDPRHNGQLGIESHRLKDPSEPQFLGKTSMWPVIFALMVYSTEPRSVSIIRSPKATYGLHKSPETPGGVRRGH